jgi:hypothetical protein
MKLFPILAVLLASATSNVTSAHAIDVFAEDVCSTVGLGCAGQASPEIVAAVEKQYPGADSVWAFQERLKNGKYRYLVTFFTNDGWHKSCRLIRLKPVKFGRCGNIHA